jgi:hypothetical protein
MYILSEIPKRLERWFIRCISPPKLFMDVLEMVKENKEKKKQDALDIQESDRLANEAEAKQAKELADTKLSNVGLRYGNSPFYRPIEQNDKLSGNTITALSTPTYQGGFKPQTQTTMGNLSGATLAPQNLQPVPPQQTNQQQFQQQLLTV